VLQKRPAEYELWIGIAAPGIVPNHLDRLDEDPSFYGLRSDGDVVTAGKGSLLNNMPASSIIRPDLYAKRSRTDRVFTAGDEVTIKLDCSAHTLNMHTPTINHTIKLTSDQPQNWVLTLCFKPGDHQVQFIGYEDNLD